MPRKVEYARKPHDINLRQVPADLVNTLVVFAEEDRRNLSSQILYVLEEYVKQRKTLAVKE